MFDNMKKSEKLLAGAVGLMLFAAAVTFGFLDFFKQFKDNKTQLAGLEKRIDDEEFRLLLALEGGDRLGLFYEPNSFPTDENEITAYQDWLEQTVRDSGLRIGHIGEPSENRFTFTTDNRTVHPIGTKYSITINSFGTLNEIIEFCFKFENIELLHRIKDLTLQPMNAGKNVNSGEVKATFKIELLALKNAEETRDYTNQDRKLAMSLDDYKTSIIARNIFGPANNAPTLSIANKTVEEEEDISVSISARDKDKGDKFTFEIVDDGGLKDAEIKPSSSTRAKFVASAMPIGEYTAIVRVTDNGFPQKSIEKEFKVTVEKKPEPPPEKVIVETKPEPVLEAPSTAISRISTRNGIPEVKIRNRMKGESYVLGEGDEFELDEKTWKIVKIKSFSVMIDVNGEVLEYTKFLNQPINKPEAESASPATSDEENESDGIAADETDDDSETTDG